MAKFTYEVPDEQLAVMSEAFCSSYGYQPTVPGEDGNPVPNPVSPNEFTLLRVKLYCEGIVKDYLLRKAQETVLAQARQQIDDAVRVDITVS